MKKWTKPTNAQMWAKFAPLIMGLGIVSVVAQCLSGYTEFFNTYSPIDPNSIMKAALLVAFIELSNRLLIESAIDNLFDYIRERNKTYLLLFLFFGLLASVVIVLSINSSLNGSENRIEMKMAGIEPQKEKVDSTKFSILQETITAQFKADSLRLTAFNDSLFAAKSTTLSAAKSAAYASIKSDKEKLDYSEESEWYSKRINNQYGIIKGSKKALRQLPKDKKTDLKLSLDKIRSNRQLAMVGAMSGLHENHSNTDSTYQAGLTNWHTKKESKKGWWGLLVFVSVFSVLIAAFIKQLGYYLSGREPEFIENPVDFATSPLLKLKEGMKVHSYNVFSYCVGIFIPSKMKFTESQIIVSQTKDNFTDSSILDEEMVNELGNEVEKNKATLAKMEAEKRILEEQRLNIAALKEEQRILREQMAVMSKKTANTPTSVTSKAETAPTPSPTEQPSKVVRQQKDNIKEVKETVLHTNTVTTQKVVFDYTKHLDLVQKYWKRSFLSKSEKAKADNKTRAAAEILIFAFNGFAVTAKSTYNYEKLTVEAGKGRGQVAFNALDVALLDMIVGNMEQKGANELTINEYLDGLKLSFVLDAFNAYKRIDL